MIRKLQHIIEQIESQVQSVFADDASGHDLHHMKRVLNVALHIQEKEGGDPLILAAAALVHDVHRIIQNETGQFCQPRDCLPQVRAILDQTDFPEEKKDQVLHCVEYHEEYDFSKTGKTVDDIETLILQDADNLDAMGAIGIGRAFTYGATLGEPLWDPDKPFDKFTYDESETDYSVIHHFYNKLLKLKDNMNTQTAKQMAASRHRYMEQFIEEFVGEWEGRR